MAILSEDQPVREEIKFKEPYTFLAKKFSSLNKLFVEIMQVKNSKLAIAEWEAGKIEQWIKEQVSFPYIKERVMEIKGIKNVGEEDKPEIKTKIQLALINALVNTEEGFVIDGVKVTPNNLKKYIEYFLFVKKKLDDNKKVKKYLEISDATILYKNIVKSSALVEKLESLSDLLNRYSNVLADYQMIIGDNIEDLKKKLLDIDEETLNRYTWSVETFKKLMQLSVLRKLMIDKKKSVHYILKFELTSSLKNIDSEVGVFKKKYQGAKGEWGLLYNKDSLTELESLLLLSAPEQVLIPYRGYQILNLIGVATIILLSMLGLIGVPYLYFSTKQDDQKESNNYYFYQVGGPKDDTVKDVSLTPDGALIVGGHTSSFGVGENDFWLFKISKDGSLEWSKTIGGKGNDIVNVLFTSLDQNYFLGGMITDFEQSSVNQMLIKLDSFGNVLWNRIYEAGGHDEIISLIELSNKTIAITGKFTTELGDSKIFIAILDEIGIPLWSRRLYDVPDGFGVSVVEGTNNEVIVFGNVVGQSEIRDLMIFSFNEEGEVVWQNSYSNLEINSQKLILPLTDGILLARKNIDLRKNHSYVNLIKIDYIGYQLWDCEISNQVGFSPTSFSQIEDAEVLDSFLLIGETEEKDQNLKNVFIKVDNNGDCSLLETPSESFFQKPATFGFIKNEDIILVGVDNYGSQRQQDIWIKRKKTHISKNILEK